VTLKITQAAREAAAEFSEAVAGKSNGHDHIADCRKGRRDDTFIVQAFQRAMNQAADEALERAADYVEGTGGAIPGTNVFAPIVSGNNMPSMSGDNRDRMPTHLRQRFDTATNNLATAIRALKEGVG